MQPLSISSRSDLAAPMRVLDNRMLSVLASGLLSSMVLLSASSLPPSLTVSQLQGLGGDSSVTVTGVLTSLRAYDSGTEVIVMADAGGEATVKVVCTPGPGPPPSDTASIGDLLRVSGDCVFEGGIPSVYCEYAGVELLIPSEEALTVQVLSASWRLFEGDRISISGVCGQDGAGALRLYDTGGGCSIAMDLDQGVEPIEGDVVADCVLAFDAATMSLVLRVSALSPAG